MKTRGRLMRQWMRQCDQVSPFGGIAEETSAPSAAGSIFGYVPENSVQENVEKEFDLELAAVRELDSFSEQVVETWQGQPRIRNEADRILALSVARGTTTFKACLHLVLGGFGREALMLNRSMSRTGFHGDRFSWFPI